MATPRLMLHATGLKFPHLTGGETPLQATVLPDMTHLIAALGLG